jgi:cytochrome c2
VVSRAVLETTPTDVKIDNASWEDVFVAKPCIELKRRGTPFAGHQAGGRLAKGPDNALLLSIGDFEFDGVNAAESAPMDPRSDLGKLISINLDTKEATIFASGLRNPQGLFASSDGLIWETEHGPDGGDEVNLLRRGENYGWPAVSYGLPYRRHQGWSQSNTMARHEGFTKPACAFVPSIGISSLLEVEGEVPLWRGDLIVTSLKDNSIWRLRRDGERIVYSERIPMGDRLRDIQELPDGSFALLTDSGKVLIVRHVPLEQKAKQQKVVVSGFEATKKVFAEAPEGPGEAEAASGKDMFDYYCATCHSLAQTNMVGPSLSGVVGRKIGSVEGYAYSDALHNANGVWTEDRIADFLGWPQDKFPGTTMPSINLPFNNYKAIAAYLKQAGGAPPAK